MWVRREVIARSDYDPRRQKECENRRRRHAGELLAASRPPKPERTPALREALTPDQIKERRKKYSLAYYYSNHEAAKERSRRAARRQWERTKLDPEYREKRLQACRDWRAKNREYDRAKKKEWRIKNPEKWKALKRKFSKSPKAKIARNLRKRVRDLIGKGARIASTQQLIGCTRPFLMQWLESKFKPGMAWNNYGTWHIDHIMPCAAFNLFDLEQQRRCFHYTNLQPLWAQENLDKSDTIPTHQPELAIPIGA